MRAILIGALAVVTLGTVVFVFVELHATSAPPPPVETAPSAPAPVVPPPAGPSPPPPAPAPPTAVRTPNFEPPPTTAAAAPPPRDPLDQVVNGKTKREWHSYYAERQRQMMAEMARARPIVERAERGEEPDPVALGEAQTTLRQLQQRIKEDLEALATIDATPP